MSIPKVLDKNILVRKIEKETKKGPLIIPGYPSAQREYEVIATGDNVINICLGDILVLTQYCGSEVKHNEISYLVINIVDILAVLPKEEHESN